MQVSQEPFDVGHALKACVKLMEPAAIRKGVYLSLGLPSNLPKILIGDGLRLRQIVLNLLGNAIKFTDEGSVWLNVSALEVGGRFNLVVEIHDTGVGIELQHQRDIFEQFVQRTATLRAALAEPAWGFPSRSNWFG